MDDDEHQRRWRLVLAVEEPGRTPGLDGDDLRVDRALAGLYDADRGGGLGRSAPQVARWLTEVRTLFPRRAVHQLQHDALERLKLGEALLEPELLAEIEPDVQLVTMLLGLSRSVPARAREAARVLVGRLVAELRQRLEGPLHAAARGALLRQRRTSRPRAREIDWDRTIRLNLRHWHPEARRLVPERLSGRRRRQNGLHDVIICLDQSGSMAASVVYASVLASALASIPSFHTRLIAFDTSVVDLSDRLADPVAILFGVQLGGGTEIARALAWCSAAITRPAETLLILVSDLHDGGDAADTVRRARELRRAGVKVLVLLALSDQGVPSWDTRMAGELAALGIPCFASTPDDFPGVFASALTGAERG